MPQRRTARSAVKRRDLWHAKRGLCLAIADATAIDGGSRGLLESFRPSLVMAEPRCGWRASDASSREKFRQARYSNDTYSCLGRKSNRRSVAAEPRRGVRQKPTLKKSVGPLNLYLTSPVKSDLVASSL